MQNALHTLHTHTVSHHGCKDKYYNYNFQAEGADETRENGRPKLS